MAELFLFPLIRSNIIAAMPPSDVGFKFIATMLSSGIVYGIIVVLLLRALKKDKDSIEAKMEVFRRKLEEREVPVMEMFSSFANWALQFIYGRSAGRRLLASLCLGVMVTFVVLSYMVVTYWHARQEMRPIKSSIEHSVDPVLFDYGNNPLHREVWRKAFEYDVRYAGEAYYFVPRFTGLPYDEIRARSERFVPRFIAAISGRPDRENLSLIALFEGTYVSPRPQWLGLLALFSFNVLIDFIAASLAVLVFRKINQHASMGRVLVVGGSFLLATAALLILSVICYQQMFRGNTGVFLQLLVDLPFGFVLFCLGLISFVGWLFFVLRDKEQRTSIWSNLLLLGGAVMFCVGGVRIIGDVWEAWSATSWQLPHQLDWGSWSYLLAAAVLIPLLIAAGCMIVALVLKSVAEPGRIIAWGYMTWVKEHQSGTQISGVVALLAVLTGFVFALFT